MVPVQARLAMEDPIRGSKDRPARHSRPMGCGLSHGRGRSSRSRRNCVRALGHVRAEWPLVAPRYVHPPPSRLAPSSFDARRLHLPRNCHWATSPTRATYGEAIGVASQLAGMHSECAARQGRCSARSPRSLRSAGCSPLNARVVGRTTRNALQPSNFASLIGTQSIRAGSTTNCLWRRLEPRAAMSSKVNCHGCANL